MSNSEVMDLLKQISARLARVEARVGGGGGGGDDDEDAGPKPQVLACDTFLSGEVASFAAACSAIGAEDMGNTATAAYAAMRAFVDMASQCYKPTESAELMALAKPMIDQIRKAGDDKNKFRRTPTEYHYNSFAEALGGSLNWTLTSGQPGMPPPAKAIKETAIDGAMFYLNKVRKENKGKPEHDAWVKALLGMLNGLMAYAKEWHKAGLTWSFNAQGAKACSEYAGGAAPAAPAATKTAAAAAPAETKAEPKKANAMARGNLFAQLSAIDQSSGRTAGLKRVQKDANGKKFVADDQAQKMTSAKKARLAKMRGNGGAGKKKAAAVKPPVCELRGKKWCIENQTGMCSVEADKCSIKHTVYIYNCNGATIQVNGKVNTIIVDKCTKTNVVFNDLMGGCELVNCKRTKVQANGQCATVAIDKTDGCVVYAGRKCFETLTVVASKSSEMNMSWPGATDDDAWNEAPIPEQYQHHIADGKVTCDVSDLYTH
jgi:adenylyl cyclase-associated protein